MTQTEEDNLIARLYRCYARVPQFQCKEDCSECCGIVPIAPVEHLNIANWMKEHHIRTRRMQRVDLLTCPYTDGNSCAIYEARPLICRLFGVIRHKDFLCPYKREPVELLTQREANNLIEEVFRLWV